jgi:hypothetical protein
MTRHTNQSLALLPSVIAGVLLSAATAAGAAGTDCGTRIVVSATNDGGTLQLTPADPIFSHSCPGGGLQVVNAGKNAFDRSYTVSCPTDTISGTRRGTGITLSGPNLTVTGCNVEKFQRGIVASGDNILIQNSAAAHSVGDGIVIIDHLSPLNANFQGSFLDTCNAVGNGGWGHQDHRQPDQHNPIWVVRRYRIG